MEMEGGEVGSGHSMIAMFEIIPGSSLAAALQNSGGMQAANKNVAEIIKCFREILFSLK